MQRAPYITSSNHNALLHNPPQHIPNINSYEEELPDENYSIAIDAFGPFILEGSKPGAAASALWFSSKMIPLNRRNHGEIIKESIIAARELHEWIFTWKKIYDRDIINPREKYCLNKCNIRPNLCNNLQKSTKHCFLSTLEDLKYNFKTFCLSPDTNVLVFVIKKNTDNTINGLNYLTSEVYKNFSIQVESGSRMHSYSQPFFLSKTTMYDENYRFEIFKDTFNKWGINIENAKQEYEKEGLVVLRVTIMSPYINAIRKNTEQNLIKDFVLELHKCANKCADEIKKS
jgi:hypothetical protein